MALAGTKVTIFFDQQGYGWTESYFTAVTIPAGITALPGVNALVAARLKCAGAQTSVVFARVIDLATKRLGYTYRVATGGTGNPSKNSDAPSTAALIRRFDSTNKRQAAWFMRGNWDDACDVGGQLSTTSLWQSQALQPFLALLVSGGWCWVGKDLASLAPSQLATLTAVQGQLTFTTQNAVFPTPPGPNPFPYRARVAVSGILGADTANGVWVVNVNSATSCTTLRQILINTYVPNTGKLTYNAQALIPIADSRFLRFVERKPGRALFRSRGRSRAKRVTW